MNQQERDALREKHRCLESKVGPWCRSCMHGWPCDVIKVLDAWEAEVHGSSEDAQRVYQEWVESQWETDVPVGFQGAL